MNTTNFLKNVICSKYLLSSYASSFQIVQQMTFWTASSQSVLKEIQNNRNKDLYIPQIHTQLTFEDKHLLNLQFFYLEPNYLAVSLFTNYITF